MSEAGARSIQLIVGLGNPGSRYADTRHNVGFVVVDELARRFGVQLKDEARFGGKWARVQIGERYVYLLQPQTYMNLSGQ
ncbi:MAG: aminoacyl-tRNA hydrolase, partial [Chlamydiia bacterium]|nr:aminoacyl-tRNA hydrolase [Chlamydiia bacterium]